ncbi:MAG: hypothetical protein GX857_10950, partial [Bacteroidales bacterium]|nr:hypothetical protein [Bacteroidales bacterium]
INEPGAYKLEFDADVQLDPNASSDYYFSVSDLASFARSTSDTMREIFVVNRSTGKPATNAKVNIYQRDNRNWETKPVLLKTTPVNSIGLAVFEGATKEQTLYYHAVVGNDNGLPLTGIPYNYYQRAEPDKEETTETISIFTDRSLYRPGQIVYFKAIAASSKDNKHSAISNKEIEFIFHDANHQEVAKQTLTTNEFGSVAGEFVLPQGLLTGNFTIEAGDERIYFKVEEYKRPTFEVTFDKIEKTYKFGEEVTLKGKAESFSGIQLQDAEVSYTITRQEEWWWRWGGGSAAEHYSGGMVTTDDNGSFEIQFTPQLTDADGGEHAIYSFTVEASVTDLNGETQVSTYSITVGTISMVLSIDMPDKMEKDSPNEIKIEAKNLDGNDIKAKGTYKVFALDDNDSIQQQVSEGTFETGVQTELKDKLKSSPSGKYRIKLSAQDDRDNTVTVEKDVVVFSYSDKRPPITTNDWLVVKNATFSKTKPAEVILGVSDKDVNVLYELWKGDKLLERKWVQLKGENRLFAIPYKEEYADGATLMLTYVKNDKFYTHNIGLMREKEKTDLNIQLDVFRDKILPGGKEEWRISVTDAKQQPALAEVMASMYDYSLSSIHPTTNWMLRLPSGSRFVRAPRLSQDGSFGKNASRGFQSLSYLDFKNFEYDAFNWFDFSFYRAYKQYVARSQGGIEIKEERVSAMDTANEEANYAMAMPPSPEEPGVYEEQKPQIRKNFDETAFFYPQLRTNEKGETVIAFTVPESNTRWHFRLLAHDKEMNRASAEAFSVSRKKLMVTPNMPRFLREGDRISISTKISNLSDEAWDASVSITFFNPITDEEITTLDVADRTQQVSLEKDGSSSVSWSFVVPDDSDVM